MKYEVRCCCQPTKLLGWFDLPQEPKSFIYLPTYEPRDRASMMSAGEVSPVGPRVIQLPIARIQHGESEAYPAIKAEGVELETLRRIPGFIEARHAR